MEEAANALADSYDWQVDLLSYFANQNDGVSPSQYIIVHELNRFLYDEAEVTYPTEIFSSNVENIDQGCGDTITELNCDLYYEPNWDYRIRATF